MATDARIARRKLSLLELASELSNVSKACGLLGCKRQRVYEIRRRRQTYGAQGLADRARGRKYPHLNRPAAEIDIATLCRALSQPTHRHNRVARELALLGVAVSAGGRRSRVGAPRPADQARAPAAAGEGHRRAHRRRHARTPPERTRRQCNRVPPGTPTRQQPYPSQQEHCSPAQRQSAGRLWQGLKELKRTLKVVVQQTLNTLSGRHTEHQPCDRPAVLRLMGRGGPDPGPKRATMRLLRDASDRRLLRFVLRGAAQRQAHQPLLNLGRAARRRTLRGHPTILSTIGASRKSLFTVIESFGYCMDRRLYHRRLARRHPASRATVADRPHQPPTCSRSGSSACRRRS